MSKLTFTAITLLAVCFSPCSISQVGPSQHDMRNQAMTKCEEYSFPVDTCKGMVDTFFNTANEANLQNINSLSQFSELLTERMDGFFSQSNVQADIGNEILLNSAVVGSRMEGSPLSLEFKAIDIEDDDTVLGLEFGYTKEVTRRHLNPSENMQHHWSLDISINGIVTQNAEDNPRNFIEAKAKLFGGSHTTIKMQHQAASDAAYFFSNEDNLDNPNAEKEFSALIDSIVAPIGGFTFLKYGLELGFESDQKFDARNEVVSGFLFVQYESWNDGSLLGSIGIVPSVRFSLDEVEPSDETPRAVAGDDSSYSRASGELSIWMPLTQFAGKELFFTFNYRTYQELSPSELVENAGLDKYHLRSYALSTDAGLFVSYSSGSLPFDLKEHQTVELGYKTYF